MIIKQRNTFGKLLRWKEFPRKEKAIRANGKSKMSALIHIMSIQVTSGQFGTFLCIKCCEMHDLVSWCWVITLCASSIILLSEKNLGLLMEKEGKPEVAAEVKVHRFLKATGSSLVWIASSVEPTGRGAVLCQKTTRCKMEWFFAEEVGRAVRSAPLHLKGIQVSSG